MIKKTTLILSLCLSLFYCANNLCMEHQEGPSAARTTDITDEESNNEEAQEPEALPTENMAALLQILRNGNNVNLILNHPTIANQILQQHVQQSLPIPKETNPIFDALTGVRRVIVNNAGVSFGQKTVEVLTKNHSTEEINGYALNNAKLAYKLNELKTSTVFIRAKRAQVQSAIFNQFKEELRTNSDNNTEKHEPENLEDECNDSDNEYQEDETQDNLLQLISSQKALQEFPLTKEEIHELSSNIDSILNHINETLKSY